MRILRIIIGIALLNAVYYTANAQELTQVVRGQVIDIESQTPLAFASIAIVTTNPVLGSISDDNGNFRLEKVPVGRHDIKVAYMGYETQVIPELMVSTGKEMVLTIKMKEQITELKEVAVKAYTKKDKPLNSMATVSARTFSVEEARRYAGGWDDPGRLVASFAGVTTDVLRDNTIIIRGNSPKGLLWRLEGIEIPNPNHFANLTTFGGGGISALSALVVGNSDFFTGAFPAEYGNAVSGVFDIKLRSGNNEKHEHAFQIGTIGLDISSEGPLGKDTRASYLFNYRYSTFGLIKSVFPEEIKDFIPVYQDLSFKINMPTKKTGIFSIWGLASDDSDEFKAEEDSSKWEMIEDRMDGTLTQRIGGLGLNHRYIFQKNAWLNTSLAITGDYMKYEGGILGYDLNRYENEYIHVRNYKYTFTSVYNRKFSAKHANRTGFIVDNMHYNTVLKHAPVYDQGLVDVVDEKGASNMVQIFSQSKFNITKRLWVNAGLRGHYFDLNNELVIEPRLGLSYNIGKAQSVSLGYGKHSRIEPLSLYFAGVSDGSGISQPNKDLKVSKAHHLVLAYDISLNPNLRLKIEPYTQILFDVPVIPDSNFSVLNMDADFYFNEELVNTGTGRNMGIEFTLERFLKDGYYYLFTASFFDSKFKGDDGIERNTRFNTQYVFNFLYGKEWIVGKQNNKIIGVNAKVNFFGGRRTTPVNDMESDLSQDVVYHYSQLYEDKEPDKFHISATVNYRINKKRHSSIWSLQMVNLLMAKENYGLYYNYKTEQVERFEFAVLVPNISYKIEF
ncbi:MAG: TonB-dependent receptor [Bacteroidales bacterium]|nr:MAG: TonB-dependent receptor [Bacteroidales bacterium]